MRTWTHVLLQEVAVLRWKGNDLRSRAAAKGDVDFGAARPDGWQDLARSYSEAMVAWNRMHLHERQREWPAVLDRLRRTRAVGSEPPRIEGGRPYMTVFETILKDLGLLLRQMAYLDRDSPFETAHEWKMPEWTAREDAARVAVQSDWRAMRESLGALAVLQLCELELDPDALEVMVDAEFLHAYPRLPDAPGSTAISRAEAKRKKAQWEYEAGSLVRDHPEWPDCRIAREVGIDGSQLSRSDTYKVIRAQARQPRRQRRGFLKRGPGGERDVEAIDDDSDPLSPRSSGSGEEDVRDSRIDAAERVRNAGRKKQRR